MTDDQAITLAAEIIERFRANPDSTVDSAIVTLKRLHRRFLEWGDWELSEKVRKDIEAMEKVLAGR